MKQQYKSYEQTCQFLNQCAQDYPNLVAVESIGQTCENREILLAKITINVESADTKPAMLFTGTVHAREWIGNELAVSFIEYLLKNYDDDPKVLRTLENNTLYIVPCLNPDGFEYSMKHFSFWRKNRRDNGDGTFGVDLNRNFSIGYVKSKDTNSNVYSGKNPFSEPETLAMKNFVDSHENITVALDYHSQGNVFFPAHNFTHEGEINGTDLNTLCANMNYAIAKVTGRKYGIHRGKPPTKLISGSGREYYYSKGIIAAVVEVGTRNIPDFMQNMKESIDENIPALILSLGEAQNYSENAPTRPQNFLIKEFNFSEVTLTWDSTNVDKDVYFQIFRNSENKEACNESTLVGRTYKNEFTDIELLSDTRYYYYIRAVNDKTKVKSPYAPKVRVKTLLESDEFSRILFTSPNDIGYVAEKTLEKNREHFGVNSLFIGVNENRGISYGVMKFNLDKIPKDAIIKEVKFSIYPLNRVNAKIEKYGEWSVSFIDQNSVSEITDFDQIHNAKIIQTLGETIPSEQLTQGIWSHWSFHEKERLIFQKHLENRSVLFKLEGPIELPVGRDSQMMMFDMGYGKFGGGIHYRPNLEVKYTMPSTCITIEAKTTATVSKEKLDETKMACGFDKNNDKIYGVMEFDLRELPNPDQTVITECYIEINNKNSTKTKQDIRYNVEFVDLDEITYEGIQIRERIEFIGYEVSKDDLQSKSNHNFIFDTFSIDALEDKHNENRDVKFVIKPTSEMSKNHLVDWYGKNEKNSVKLVVKYIKKRKYAVAKVTNLKTSVDSAKVRLTWDNPKDKDFVGVYVVRNSFHPPLSPYDGAKIYAGSDSFTYDDFGTPDKSKYYSVFTYDDVPNFSEAETIFFNK
ncbi:MAG: peptidase [Helicobacteraceae bacterium]|nr:peptidase [Helicobacteraceae bacterium]